MSADVDDDVLSMTAMACADDGDGVCSDAEGRRTGARLSLGEVS
ncbi:hypothetical protein ACFLIM_32550 [Nonomuraea sp. M3C6]|uniref:Uncharacterized protein n=1 Tax=Nonomuraea marmarensis TaxID=3351344 RepID=A0ABW7APA4_9ACTN